MWSVTSYNELRREALVISREHRLNPSMTRRKTHVEKCFYMRQGPVIAATDYVAEYADQIREYVRGSYTVLGTDGYGRSDTRKKLRAFFEVDRFHIVVTALYALSQEGHVSVEEVEKAMKTFNIDSNKQHPTTV